MKKDIYVIKNDINNKLYIGQSVDPHKRFNYHCQQTEQNTLIDKAINHYGKEHFWYEILESQIENYNEREIYWIQYYNSLVPNGYNISTGGQGMLNGTQCCSSIIRDEQVLLNIISDLQNTSLSYADIAVKYNIPNEVIISRINTGTSYKKSDLNYPLRKVKANLLLDINQEKELKYLLKTSCLSFKELAKKFNISQVYVRNINEGLIKIDKNEDYPLRKGVIRKNSLTTEELDEIYDLIINTKLSLREISRRFNRDPTVITAIKNGKTQAYRREGYEYPLRKNNFKKPVSTISAKESTITIDT